MIAWPPRDVRQFAALVFSVLGGVALTVLIGLGGGLLVHGSWTATTEAARAAGLVQVLVILSVGVVVVMVGLGWAINRRQFRGQLGGDKGAKFDLSGGEEDGPAARAAAKAAEGPP